MPEIPWARRAVMLALVTLVLLPGASLAARLVSDDFDHKGGGEGFEAASSWGAVVHDRVTPPFRGDSGLALGTPLVSGSSERPFAATAAADLNAADDVWIGIAMRPGAEMDQFGMSIDGTLPDLVFIGNVGLSWFVALDSVAYPTTSPVNLTAWSTLLLHIDFVAGSTRLYVNDSLVTTIPAVPTRDWQRLYFSGSALARYDNLRIGTRRAEADPSLADLGDLDGDGLGNQAELQIGSDPGTLDTDADLIPDFQEVRPACVEIVPFPANCIYGAGTDVFNGLGGIDIFPADFDRDGQMDLAFQTSTSGVILSYATFQETSALTPPTGARLAVGDLDGDGYPDFASASHAAGEVSWYPSVTPPFMDPVGRDFGPSQLISTSIGAPQTGPTPGLAIADLDSDGDSDVVVLSALDQQLRWWQNDGSGSFVSGGAPLPSLAGTGDTTLHLRTADLDGDGDQDVVTFSSGGIEWWRNADGLGTSLTRTTISATTQARELRIGDIDTDGDLDLVYVSSDGTNIGYLPGDGAGGFATPPIEIWQDTELRDISLGDTDADGDLDIAVATFRASVQGVDTEDLYWIENLSGVAEFGNKDRLAIGMAFAVAVRVVDKNGDGLNDVVGTSIGSSDPQRLYLQLGLPTNPLVGDTDGDGLVDGFELAYGFDPNVGGEENVDEEPDGLDNLAEQAAGTNPLSADTDLDGLGDAAEIAAGLDPTDADTDNDDLCDGGTALGAPFDSCPFGGEDEDADGVLDPTETDPALPDTDGDGLKDGFEVRFGFDPRVPGEALADPDGDALDNLTEQAAGSNPYSADTDGDGIDDAFEYTGATDPANSDTDGDGLLDGFEVTNFLNPNAFDDASLDSDLDGLTTSAEQGAGTFWFEDDSDQDGLLDGFEQRSTGFGDARLLFPAAGGAYAVHAADVDRDGDMDVLTGTVQGAGDSRLSWFENLDGQGHFGSENLIWSGNQTPREIVAADLDGDGDLDVVVAYDDLVNSANDKVAWHENLDGRGTFGSQRVLPPLVPGVNSLNPRSVFAADIDDDGDLDVAMAATRNDEVAWWKNLDGQGNFGPSIVITILVDDLNPSEVDDPVSIVVSDVTGDGDLDVLTASFADDSISLFEGARILSQNRIGVVFAPAQSISNSADQARTVAVADLDRDGDGDLLSASEGDGKIAWYENLDGQGTFGSEQIISSAAGDGTWLHVADMDGDGDIDVVTASTVSDELAWYENDGTPGGVGDWAKRIVTTSAGNPTKVFAADLDGDGDKDVLSTLSSSATGTPSVVWFEHRNLTEATDWDVDDDGLCDGGPATGSGTPTACTLGGEDLNGNGILDAGETDPRDPDFDDDGLVDGFEVANDADPFDRDEDGNLRIDGQDDWDLDDLGNAAEQAAGSDPREEDTDGDGLKDGDELASGIFSAQKLISQQASEPISIIGADLDGDGDEDVVTAALSSNRIAWYENTDGKGAYGPLQLINNSAWSTRSVFASDLDGDGDLDVLYASEADDEISWQENTDGMGTFGLPRVISAALLDPLSVTAADVDGDGDMDVLSASQNDDKIAWYENTDGEGTFGPQRVISSSANGAWWVSTADVDGDGDVDVLSASHDDDKIAWYENTDGEGTFGPQRVISTLADGATCVTAADIDGDGDEDVVSSSMNDNEIAWYENLDGLGGFGPQQVISTAAAGATAVVAADVDADGWIDVLSASTNDGRVSWFRNTDGYGSFGPRNDVTSSLSSAWSIFATDVDGDSDVDVLATGVFSTTSAWFENLNATDVLKKDTDEDGLDDLQELTNGLDPRDGDQNQNGQPDGQDDWDLDGLDNVTEAVEGTLLDNDDSDGDGLIDGVEVGGPKFVSQPSLTNAALGARVVVSADLDGDGDLDAIAGSASDDTIEWFENVDGLGTYLPGDVITVKADGVISLFAVDIDGDDDVDVLSASNLDNTLGLHRNVDGLGGFESREVISTALVVPTSVFAGDLDRDGDVDVLSTSFDGKVAWYENLGGTGTFGPQIPITTTLTSAQFGTAADVDGDGDLDVIASSLATDGIEWFENVDGGGSFGPAQIVTNSTSQVAWVGAADVDADGDLDVLSASVPDDEVAWYENDGSPGGLGDWTKRSISTATDGAISVAAADIDSDGDLDVFVASSLGDSVDWFENLDGAGTYGLARTIVSSTDSPVSVHAADVDGNGSPDLLYASSNQNVVGLHRQAHGTDALDGDSDDDGLCDGGPAAGGTLVTACGLGGEDVDGSGLLEPGETDPTDPDTDSDEMLDVFEIASGSDGLEVDQNLNGIVDGRDDFDGDGLGNAAESVAGTDPYDWDSDLDGLGDGEEFASGTFGAEQLISSSAGFATSVELADLDGDGDADVLATSHADDTVAWHENVDGLGAFGPARVLSSTALAARSAVAGDMDGDGDLDVVSGSSGDDTVGWFENEDGLGGFGPRQTISSAADEVYSVFLEDLDGDGDLDVLSASRLDGKLAWYRNIDGQGTFGPERTISTTAANASQVRAADVDGDGDQDVLAIAIGDIYWFENTNGLGIFGSPRGISAPAASPRSIFSVDVDGDGDVDVLEASDADDTIAWYANLDGRGQFGPRLVISAVHDEARSVFGADVDADGDLDVISASSGDGEVAWFENLDGLGAFASPQYVSTTATGAWAVVAGDVDGDVDLDILISSFAVGEDEIAWYAQEGLSDPAVRDTDGDGFDDGREVALRSSPSAANSQPTPGQLVLVEPVLLPVASKPPDPDTGIGYAEGSFIAGRYEVTNAAYATFLNAIAAESDPAGVYDALMSAGQSAGIERFGSPGHFVYFPVAGRADWPVIHVSVYDAARYVNWLGNGQPIGTQDATTTEDGTYTNADPSNGRNQAARWFLPTLGESYKAAYYDPESSPANYFDFPAGSDTPITCSTPSPAPDTANCGGAVGALTDVGSYPNAPSPAGLFDLGGNAAEWTETTAEHYPVVSVSSDMGELDAFYALENLINGSGLTGAEHETGSSGHWASSCAGSCVVTGTITFELGAISDLGAIDVWNYAELADASYGVQDLEVEVSDDGVAYTPVGSYSLSIVGGAPALAERLILPAETRGRFVRLVILSNHGASGTGLSEVQFVDPVSQLYLVAGGDFSTAAADLDRFAAGLLAASGKTAAPNVGFRVAPEPRLELMLLLGGVLIAMFGRRRGASPG